MEVVSDFGKDVRVDALVVGTGVGNLLFQCALVCDGKGTQRAQNARRRTRVVGAFPDGQSCLNLAAARLRYIAGTAWSAKCYMNMRPLYQPQVPQTEAVA